MKKFIILYVLSVITLFTLTTRIVYQPEYDHYVIGSTLIGCGQEFTVVFSLENPEIHAIWLGKEILYEAPYIVGEHKYCGNKIIISKT